MTREPSEDSLEAAPAAWLDELVLERVMAVVETDCASRPAGATPVRAAPQSLVGARIRARPVWMGWLWSWLACSLRTACARSGARLEMPRGRPVRS